MKITSHIKNAFEWWLQGLLYFCPHSFKRSIGLYPDQITVELKDDSVIFKRFSVDSNEPIEIQRFMIADDVQRLSVLTWLHEYQKKHVKISLLLSDTSFLKKISAFLQQLNLIFERRLAMSSIAEHHLVRIRHITITG